MLLLQFNVQFIDYMLRSYTYTCNSYVTVSAKTKHLHIQTEIHFITHDHSHGHTQELSVLNKPAFLGDILPNTVVSLLLWHL